MVHISHRGNLKSNEWDSNPIRVNQVLDLGYDVEVDVWVAGGKYLLGHDQGKYEVTKDFLANNKLWCHAKNLPALNSMLDDDIHCFWHQEDSFTLTSKNFVWTYPGQPTTSRSVIVCRSIKEASYYKDMGVYGICSDYAGLY